MGGGGDSRIPSILCEELEGQVVVVCRTYDFDPEKAALQIASWVAELGPSLVIGESLGAVQAIRVRGVPHLFVSPSLGGPLWLSFCAWLCLIPGVSCIFDRVYKPREGDRQKLHFTFHTLRKYPAHRHAALACSPKAGGGDYFYAFFGTHDHYRRSGVVSVKAWRRYFGDGYCLYEGSHFMEEEFVRSMLVPKILEVLHI